ncbi:hypothetical protein [Streptomyces hirsutus]|uniref:hypothetical protein n=1 Tax=Streptomyces hirsutus TaxID=35620 RepID=UPI0033165322
MTRKQPVHRRLAASVLGADRTRRRPPTAEQQRRLGLPRRLLASLLGIRVRPPAPTAHAAPPPAVQTQTRTDTEPEADAQVPAKAQPKAQAEAHVRLPAEGDRTTARTMAAHHPQREAAPPEAGPSGLTPEPVDRHTLTHGLPSRRGSGRGAVPQHLLSEDRPAYEKILDEALRSAPRRPELAAVGERLSSEQLRTMALNATGLITAAAAAEYQHYVKIRQELHGLKPSQGRRDAAEPESSRSELAGAAITRGAAPAGPPRARMGAAVAVLAPVLSGGLAVLFLLVGYLLRTLDPDPGFTQAFLTAGWVFGTVTGACVLIAAVVLIRSALRAGAPPGDSSGSEPDTEVARAREAWKQALLERGLVPFLRDALADPSGAAARGQPSSAPRVPQLGYARPGFTSPDEHASGPHPRYTSPDYTSPDFGGSEHQPE